MVLHNLNIVLTVSEYIIIVFIPFPENDNAPVHLSEVPRRRHEATHSTASTAQ